MPRQRGRSASGIAQKNAAQKTTHGKAHNLSAIERRQNRLGKRPPLGLLAGLWGFPAMEGHLKKEEVEKALKTTGFIPLKLQELPSAQHIFSHITWQMVGWHIHLAESSSGGASLLAKAAPEASEDAAMSTWSSASLLHEAAAPYTAAAKIPPLLWATAQEIIDTYSVPAAYRSYFPYICAESDSS